MTLDFFLVKDYLQGKPVYAIARRALNFLFSVSITSFLFERFYFKYTWMDITAYKAILDFLVKGYFLFRSAYLSSSIIRWAGSHISFIVY